MELDKNIFLSAFTFENIILNRSKILEKKITLLKEEFSNLKIYLDPHLLKINNASVFKQ